MTATPAVALEACLALLEKAVEGELKCHDGPDGYQHRISAGILGVCDVFASSDAAAIVAAVNTLRTHGPALLAALRLREACMVRTEEWRVKAKSAANGPMFDGASEYAVAGTFIECADDLALALEEGE